MERPGKEHSPHAQGRANSACLLHAVVGMPSSVPVQSITPGARCGSYHRSHAASRLHARLAIRLFDALPTKSSLPSEDSLHLALRTGPLPTTTFRAVVSGDPGVRRRQEPIRHPLSVPDLVQLILGSPTMSISRGGQRVFAMSQARPFGARCRLHALVGQPSRPTVGETGPSIDVIGATRPARHSSCPRFLR